MRKLLIVLLVIFASCEEKKEMHITEYADNEGILVDVRTPMEYELGHLEDAVNINWQSPGFTRAFDTIPRDRKIYVYCQKGGRSAKAAAVLDSLGYQVVDLLGGYSEFQP